MRWRMWSPGHSGNTEWEASPYMCEFPLEVTEGLQFVLTSAPPSILADILPGLSLHRADPPNLLPVGHITAGCLAGR